MYVPKRLVLEWPEAVPLDFSSAAEIEHRHQTHLLSDDLKIARGEFLEAVTAKHAAKARPPAVIRVMSTEVAEVERTGERADWFVVGI